MDPNPQFWFRLDWFNDFATILPPLMHTVHRSYTTKSGYHYWQERHYSKVSLFRLPTLLVRTIASVIQIADAFDQAYGVGILDN